MTPGRSPETLTFYHHLIHDDTTGVTPQLERQVNSS